MLKFHNFKFSFRIFYILLSAIVSICILFGLYLIVRSAKEKTITPEITQNMRTETIAIESPTEKESNVINIKYPDGLETAKKFDKLIASKYCVLIDIENNKILAERNADEKCIPLQ